VLAAATAPRPAGATGLHLVTRHDRARNQTVTETAETIDFTGQLSGEVRFSVRLAQVHTPESRSVALDVRAWAGDAYPLITTGTLTIETDGESCVLRPLPGRKRKKSHAREKVSYEEHFGYALPDGLLQKLCSAENTVLRFKTYRGIMVVDAATIQRFQAYCRGFYQAVIQPAGSAEGGAAHTLPEGSGH
jgi:hypothetical protein